MNNYISVGITGGIGSGKTYVCRTLEAMGYPVFFSDIQAKQLLVEDQEAIASIKKLFGDQAYIGNELNRPFLAEKIFSAPSYREMMNNIVHPLVRKRYSNWAEATDSPIVFNEAAILFETGSYKNFDFNVLVTAPINLRIERTMKRDGVSELEVEARMKAQWSDDKKKELADFIINNDEKEPLVPQIVNMLEAIK
jgi:dephospho-CoA kinase